MPTLGFAPMQAPSTFFSTFFFSFSKEAKRKDEKFLLHSWLWPDGTNGISMSIVADRQNYKLMHGHLTILGEG